MSRVTKASLQEKCDKYNITYKKSSTLAELLDLCKSVNKGKSNYKSKSKTKSKSKSNKSKSNKSKSKKLKGTETVAELREIAKKLGITLSKSTKSGRKNLTKAELIEEISGNKSEKSPKKSPKKSKSPTGLISKKTGSKLKMDGVENSSTMLKIERKSSRIISISISNGRLYINNKFITPKKEDNIKKGVLKALNDYEANGELIDSIVVKFAKRMINNDPVLHKYVINIQKNTIFIDNDDNKKNIESLTKFNISKLNDNYKSIKSPCINKCDGDKCIPIKKTKCMMKDKSGRSLQNYQVQVISAMMDPKRKGLLAIHGIGSGKSLTAVVSAECLYESKQVKKIILVTKAGLIKNFQGEMHRYGSSFPIDYYSFEKLMNMYKSIGKSVLKTIAKDNLVIIDEAHEIRTETTIKKKGIRAGFKAQAAIELCKYAKKVLLLTATPLVNYTRDIINLMAMVKGIDPITKTEFNKLKTLDKLSEYFSCDISYYKCSKDVIDPNYPEVILGGDHGIIDMYMNDKYYKEYKKIEMNISKKKGIDAGKPVTNMFYKDVRRNSNILDRDHPEISPKIEWISNFLLNNKNGPVKGNGKTVVYSSFLSFGIDAIAKILRKKHIPFSRISGSTLEDDDDDKKGMNQTLRQEELEKYNTNKTKILLISAAGGTGLNLLGTRNFILTEPQFNNANEEQAIGRAIRNKSHSHLAKKDQNVTIYRLMLHKPKDNTDKLKSADDSILELGQYKQKMIDEFINDYVIPLSIENNSVCK